jgi:hypothetical protein
MSVMATQYRRVGPDHFEPRDDDPIAERRLRGQLERIDYTAYAANREILAAGVGKLTGADFQKLACAAAQARAAWAKAALQAGACSDGATTGRLAELRRAFEELQEAYEGLRRLVERGYCAFDAGAAEG